MLTLEETKLYLRVDADYEDAAIVGMMEAATAATADYLNSAEPLASTAAAPIKAAALLLVADLYENRAAQSDRQTFNNPTYERLLNPYRAMVL